MAVAAWWFRKVVVRRPARTVLAAAAAVFAAGCGDSRPATYPVSGVVRVNGVSAEGAEVVLHPVNGDQLGERRELPFGKVSEDGTFRLSTFAPGDGAPAGEYAVALTWPRTGGADGDRLGGAYESPHSQTAPKVVISPDATELPPIEITVRARKGR